MAEKDEIMYLLDLPADLNPGRVPLKPENGFCYRLTLCHGCLGHSAKAILAACGHAFCRCCAIVSSPEPNTGDIHLWCSVCQSKQEADPHPESKILDKMKFSCRCGVEGSLREIKKHFWIEPERGGHRRVASEEDTAQIEAKQTREVAATGEHENSINAFGERVQSLGQQLQNLREVANTISKGITSLESCAGHHGQGVFWVPVQKLIDEYRRQNSNVHSALYKWHGNGNMIGTQFMILNKGDEPYFGAVHRASFDTSNEPFKPYRMLIGVKVLDLYGVTVETGITATYEGSKPVKAFEKPLPDYANGGVGPYLISVAALMRPEAKIATSNGLVNVTIECLPPLI